jgi:molecular chaperone GrpE
LVAVFLGIGKKILEMSEQKENQHEEIVENNPPQVEDFSSTEEVDNLAQEADNKEEKSEGGKDWLAAYNELNDKYLRLYSEFDNYRKRTIKEKADLNKLAGEEIFKAILPVIDDFERALKSMESAQEITAVKEGVNLIYSKFKNSLTSKGLESIESIGQVFDSDLHEALTNIPAPSEDLKGKVVDEIERCYKLHGKVIRYAKVVVGQ